MNEFVPAEIRRNTTSRVVLKLMAWSFGKGFTLGAIVVALLWWVA